MTPPSLAHALLTPEGNLAAIPAAPDAAALELLERLVIESHRAAAAVKAGDTDSLHELLATRGQMITALEELGKIVAPHIGPHRARRAQAEATRASLIIKSRELQQLNVRLLECVRAEAARLSVAIAGVDRGESGEEAYRPTQGERTSNLDLMR